MKPLLKITFVEPTRFKIDNLSVWVNFVIVPKVMRASQFVYFHFGNYKNISECNFDYMELDKIKSIEFINPTEL